jgi:glycosyltransferase involved in cell wall biosynthesis
MRIIQVLAGAKTGGAETAYVDMCVAMKEAGQDIIAITRENDIRVPRLLKANIPVHTLRFGGKPDIFTAMKMKRIIQAVQPDIVQTWMSRAAQKTPRWSPSMKIKPYKTVARLGGYYARKNFKNTDYFVTITPDLKRYLVDQGFAANDITQINNFAETEAISAPVSRADMDTPEDAVVLLTLSRLHEAKALDTLMKAIADLPQSVAGSIYLWLAGAGPDHDALVALSKALGIENNVRFLGWRNDRAALLQAADICVFPSRYEPFGTVFVQAWASKTPLIVSDADGPRQFVRDKEDGLMFSVDDVAALKNAIKTLYDDLKNVGESALCHSLSTQGYQRYSDEFTKDKCVNDYVDWYKEILKRD